jgi:hypothetical protein
VGRFVVRLVPLVVRSFSVVVNGFLVVNVVRNVVRSVVVVCFVFVVRSVFGVRFVVFVVFVVVGAALFVVLGLVKKTETRFVVDAVVRIVGLVTVVGT